MSPNFDLERRAGGFVAGVDEAGRGPWAGPVVAAAVVFAPPLCADIKVDDLFSRLDDSKKLTHDQRQHLYHQIQKRAAVGIGEASVGEIESLNILGATMLAMRRALAQLPHPPDSVLVDGNRAPDIVMPVRAVVGGDGRCCSIAAASIIAKVTRDCIMGDLARHHPGYGWERNAGYGTPEHRAALATRGLTIHHRRCFRPIRALIEKEAGPF